MDREKSKYVIKVASTYIGTVIGAGFASGREICIFFTNYGKISYVSLLISTMLFMCIGSNILVLGRKLNVNCYGDMIKDIFKGLAPFVDIYLFIVYVIISVAMFAGAGALFSKYYWLCILITAGFAVLAIINGLDGLLNANIIIIPMILLFDIILFVYHIEFPVNLHKCSMISLKSLFNSLKSSLIYTSYNTILCIGVMAPLGNRIENSFISRRGGYIGGLVIGIMLFISNYCIFAYMPHISLREMPLLDIAKTVNPIFGWCYVLMLWGAIFTTLIANLFSITSILERFVPSYLQNVVFICMIIIISLFAKFGFSNIVSIFYPILGIIGLIFITYMALFPVTTRD